MIFTNRKALCASSNAAFSLTTAFCFIRPAPTTYDTSDCCTTRGYWLFLCLLYL